ncbi:hypothetical protein [Streptomyces sp. NPDC002054]|uniref:hypothetical protein n=1 Tax=Streptomyces sp. NPDC002054 TaxID=3154663 RepID=UPI00332C405F
MKIIRGAIALVAAGTLAACSGGGTPDAAQKATPTAAGGPTATGAEQAAPPQAGLKVPAAYDASKGWQLKAEQAPQFGVLPKAGLVMALTGKEGTYRVTAYEAATGRVRWESRPFKKLQQSPAPQLFVTGSGGAEHLVVWSTGESAGDALTKAQKVYSIDIFAADGSGSEVAPRHLDVPMPDGGRHEVLDGGTRLLLDSTTSRVTAVDPATGALQTIEPKSLTPPAGCSSACRGDQVKAVTAKGPVLTNSTNSTARFWSPAGWDATTIAPAGAEPSGGSVWPVAGGRLLARWDEKGNPMRNLWAVLDAESGQVQASVTCEKPFIPSGTDPDSAVSPNGRFLVSKHLAFDLEGKKGHCFVESDTAKPLTFRTVTDEGTAYGVSVTRNGTASGAEAPVQLSLSTGTPQPLESGAITPTADFAGIGVFEVPLQAGGGLVVHPRKS